MRISFIICLIISLFVCPITYNSKAQSVDDEINMYFSYDGYIKVQPLSKKLDLYQFGDNELGQFLKEFCDTCRKKIPHFSRTVISPPEESLVCPYIKDLDKLGDDYIVIYTNFIEKKLFDISYAGIQGSDGYVHLIATTNDLLIEKLGLKNTFSEFELVFPNPASPIMTIDDIIAIVDISSNRPKILVILYNLHRVQEYENEEFNYFKELLNKYKD